MPGASVWASHLRSRGWYRCRVRGRPLCWVAPSLNTAHGLYTVQYSTVQYSTVLHTASTQPPESRRVITMSQTLLDKSSKIVVQYSTVQCSTVQYSTAQYSTAQQAHLSELRPQLRRGEGEEAEHAEPELQRDQYLYCAVLYCTTA